MNIFKTNYNGGLPLVLDDFRWIDSGYRQAFRGIMSAFGVTDQYTFIISGCERTVNAAVVTIAEGYVSIGGEICYVPEHNYSEPTGVTVEFWTILSSYDATGSKVFQNSSVNDAYEIRTGKISVASSVPSGSTSFEDTKTIHELIHEKLPVDSWHNVLTENITTADFLNGIYKIDCKKDLSGFVHLRGLKHIEDQTAGVADDLITTLPVGYRPIVQKQFVIGVIIGTEVGMNIVDILTNGEVRVKMWHTAFTSLLDFSQIPPFESA